MAPRNHFRNGKYVSRDKRALPQIRTARAALAAKEKKRIEKLHVLETPPKPPTKIDTWLKDKWKGT